MRVLCRMEKIISKLVGGVIDPSIGRWMTKMMCCGCVLVVMINFDVMCLYIVEVGMGVLKGGTRGGFFYKS